MPSFNPYVKEKNLSQAFGTVSCTEKHERIDFQKRINSSKHVRLGSRGGGHETDLIGSMLFSLNFRPHLVYLCAKKAIKQHNG